MAKVLLTGGTGFIGQHLCRVLLEKGYEVSILSRRASKTNDSGIVSYYWNIESNEMDKEALHSCDYIIHLAGVNIGEKRWTSQRKEQIIHSRVKSADLILKNILGEKNHLKAFISASATGYYGSKTSETVFSETDQAADDFTGTTCEQWEEAADKFIELGSRVVKVRTGIVLSDNAGVFPRLRNPTRLGLGVGLGKGKQYLPWIHIDDLCNIYLESIENMGIEGPINAVAPEHISNIEFVRKIAKRYRKSVWLPNIPSALIKLVFGEMSAIILNGSRVSSEKIRATGFKFQFPNIDSALHDLDK